MVNGKWLIALHSAFTIYHLPLIEVVADLEQEKMIALSKLRVAERIREISRCFRRWFVNQSGRKIAARVFAGDPVGGDRKF